MKTRELVEALGKKGISRAEADVYLSNANISVETIDFKMIDGIAAAIIKNRSGGLTVADEVKAVIVPTQSTSLKARKAAAIAKQQQKQQESLAAASAQRSKALDLSEQAHAERRDANEAIAIDIRTIKEIKEASAKSAVVDVEDLVQSRVTAEVAQMVEVELGVAERVAQFTQQFRSVMSEAAKAQTVESFSRVVEQFDFFAQL